MAKIDRDGNWKDARGRLVHGDYVPELDKLRDSMVERVHKLAIKTEEFLLATKLEVVAEVEAYLEAKAKAGKVKEGWKGNVALDSFDGSKRIERSMNDIVAFSEQIQMVKTIIDEWISERLDGVDEALVTFITAAFNVNSRGRLNTAQIMKLLQYDIRDTKWKKAMKLLRDSIQVLSSKQHFLISEKITTDSGEQRRNICLNFTDVSIQSVSED